MQIPLNVILYQLSEDSNYEAQNIDLSKGYSGVKLFDPMTHEERDENYLYIAPPEGMPSYRTSCAFLCICPDESILIDQFTPDTSMILLYTSRAFSSIFNQILNIFMDFDRWDKEFHLALLKRASLQSLLDLSRAYLVHPMVVLDRNYSLLGYIKNPGSCDPIMESILEMGYVTPQTMTRLRQDGLISAMEDVENPLINYYCLTTKECYYSMMYRFYNNNYVVGYAIVFRCSVHPKTTYLYVMNAIAKNLQLYFQQERYQNRSTSEMYESLFSAIMESPSGSLRQYEDQISYIPGLSLEGHFLLARIDYVNRIELPYSFACWNLRNSIPELKPFIYQNSLYILRVMTDSENFASFLSVEEERTFCSIFRDYPFTCGISGAFFSLLDLPTAAIQCEEAIQLGVLERRRDEQVFYNFGDVHTHYLLKELKKHVPMSMISSPCYTVLKQYDKEHSSDLCEIFMQYLKNGRNINQTAAALFLHRNTVLNKIKKATAVMHNDFEDSQMLIAFIMSYLNDRM